MTNKEAIEILQREDSVCIETDEALEAYELAIEALKKMDLIKFNVYALNELMKEADNEYSKKTERE